MRALYLIAILFSIQSHCAVVNGTWNVNKNGDWNDPLNWTSNPYFPNGVNATSTFGPIIKGNRNITLGEDITVGTVIFNDNNRYQLLGGNNLTFEASSYALLEFSLGNKGDHILACPIVLNSDLIISNESHSSSLVRLTKPISGNGGITKVGSGAGLIRLEAVNTYLGETRINEGQIIYYKDGAIPHSSFVTLGDGSENIATLLIDVDMSSSSALSIDIGSNGALKHNSGDMVMLNSLEGSGVVDIYKNSSSQSLINITGSASTTFSGMIQGGFPSTSSNPNKNNRLIKGGPSTLTLSGNSSYTSRTFIEEGVIVAQSNNALGVAGSGSAVYVRSTGASGSLCLENGIELPKTLFLNGDGALRNVSGMNEVTGDVQIGWSGGGEVQKDVTICVDGSSSLTLSGSLKGVKHLSKIGGGALELSGSSGNSFSGNVTVEGGVLTLKKMGDIALNGSSILVNGGSLFFGSSDQINPNATLTLTSGSVNLFGENQSLNQLIYEGGRFFQGVGRLTLTNDLLALKMGSTTLSGPVTLAGAGKVVCDEGIATIAGGMDLGGKSISFDIQSKMSISGDVTNGGIVKDGPGTLTLNGNNSYAGETVINSGQLRGTPNGIKGPIMNHSSFVLDLEGIQYFSSGVSGNGTFVKEGAGTVILEGAEESIDQANLTILDGTIALGSNNPIVSHATMSLLGGEFDLGGFSQSLDQLQVIGGALSHSGGALNLSSDIVALSMQNGILSAPIILSGMGSVVFDSVNGGSATISGSIDLGGFSHNFNIGKGSTDIDMHVTGDVSNGSIVKLGLGTLALTGNNSYLGVTLSEGGLITSSTNLSGPIVNDGVLVLDSVSQQTLSGVVTGAGTIEKMGSGELVLGIGASIEQPFSIYEGVVTVGAMGQLNSSTQVELKGGTLNLASFPVTIEQLNLESGTLLQGDAVLDVKSLKMQQGTISGPLVLSGTGGVIYEGGSETAFLTGPIDLGGSSTFHVDKGSKEIDMIVSGTISNGELLKSGSGTLALIGTKGYVGATTIQEGTLLGNTASLQGNVTNDANLIFNQVEPGIFAGSLTGSGNVVKEGLGTLTFSGSSTVDGSSTVQEGKFQVHGSLGGTGSLTVAQGATLGGKGTIHKNGIFYGTLAPGASIGTINLVGAQIFASGFLLENELNPTSTDLTDITGTLNIQPNSTVLVIPEESLFYSFPTTYRIVQTTGGITGSFESAITTKALLSATLQQTANDIFLHLDLTPFSQIFTEGNAAAVGGSFDSIGLISGGDLGYVLNQLVFLPTLNDVKYSLLQIDPSLYTSLTLAQEYDSLYLTSALSNRLEIRSCDCEYRGVDLWVSPLGGYSSQASYEEHPGYSCVSPGVFIGGDFVSCSNIMGGGIGYTDSYLRSNEQRGKGWMQKISAAFYGMHSFLKGDLEYALTGGYDFYKFKRNIRFAAIDRQAKSSHSGLDTSLHLKGSLRVDAWNTVFSPFGAFDYLFFHEFGFKEKGAGSLNLKIKSKNSDLLSLEGGLEISRCISFSRASITPFAQVSGVRETRFQGEDVRACLDGGYSMTVHGMNPDRTFFKTSAGLRSTLSETHQSKQISALSFYYQGKFGSGFNDQSFYFQLVLDL